ncbi:MAG: RimK family protein [Glaciecola sp.]|jgi:glutathione synthase/RimK-type ligase-like ATP-grasp enzyme
MITTLIVVDSLNDFPALELDATVLDFESYLADYPKLSERKTRVINLCNTNKYLSKGYYCSLLAEARHHKVLPSVNTINDLIIESTEQSLEVASLTLPKALSDSVKDSAVCDLVFGTANDDAMQAVAKYVFDRFPAPYLQISVSKQVNSTSLKVRLGNWDEVISQGQTFVVKALQDYLQKNWVKRFSKKSARWDMAILCNENEATPPSDKKALKHFVQAAKKVGINAQLIDSSQAANITHFDALFIRETTAINHPTYHLARKAEREGLVVIDDANSILKCCNKVFLQDAFSYHKVPVPKSGFAYDSSDKTCTSLAQEFGFPMVLKLPESSFSLGVFKVKDETELKARLAELLHQSALVLVQEYVFTEFDWRIGVLNGKPIYACRYFMARGHWQIYNHASSKNTSGGFETLPTFEVPKSVLDAAIKASGIIGKGLYGVDIKQANGKVYVIEVNDNPSIESKVEDKYLGKELYMIIMQEFANRLEARGR